MVGNLGNDPEVKTLNNDQKVATFSMATSEKFTNKAGEKVETTEWHRVVVWRALAEVVEKYLHKGDKVYIEGKITTRKYTDKDSAEKSITEIVADKLTMLGGVRSAEPQAAPTPVQVITREAGQDDLPF